MKKLRFTHRRTISSYEGDLTVALQISCTDAENCYHDSFYLTDEQFKQIPGAAQKFNVERTHNSADTDVYDGSNSRHGRG